MVRFDCEDRISRNEITLLSCILNRKRSLEWIPLVLITAGQTVFAADQVIEVSHTVVVLKNGGYRIILKRIPSIRTARIAARSGNHVAAVGQSQLKDTD